MLSHFLKFLDFLIHPHKSSLYGTARYMGIFEKWQFLSRRNQGFVIGKHQRLSEEQSFQNLMLVAPTGMGKTSRFIIPNILKSTGSIVVTDPSGEIFSKTSGYMKAIRGYDVLVFNPTDLEHSIRLNYLIPFSGSPQKIKQIATILGKHNSSHGDAFWVTQATNILYIVISALVNASDPHYLNLANVRWLLNNFGLEGEGIEKFMVKNLSDAMFTEYKAFLKQDTKVLMNSLSTARAALDLWSDPDICRLTSDHSIDFDAFRQKKTILYLIVPEHQVSYFSLILNLTYSAFFTSSIENGMKHFEVNGKEQAGLPIWFLMDEFANVGEIQHFHQIITVSRKRRMPIAIILQDLAQLSAVYGKDSAQTIAGGGCGNRLFYAGLDIDTCQRIERILGTKTTIDEETENEHKVASPLKRASDVRLLADNEYLLIASNKRPIKGKAQAYFKNWKLKKATEMISFQFKAPVFNSSIEYLPLEKKNNQTDSILSS